MQVSDHAVVRYLERVMGININKLKKEILSKLPRHTGVSCKYPVGNGCRAVIHNDTVTTVMKGGTFRVNTPDRKNGE